METIIVGIFSAIITFFYMKWQIKKTHESNLEAQKTLFKQEIEYKAYCAIQEALYKYWLELSKFDSYLRMLQTQVSLLHQNITLRKDWADIPRELREINNLQNDKKMDLLIVYDSNEIVLLDFKPIRDEIVRDTNILSEMFENFYKTYLDKIGTEGTPTKEGIPEIEKRIKQISEKILDIICYLSMDFRVELQNKILGSILEKSLPKRQPEDKSVKVLSLEKEK